MQEKKGVEIKAGKKYKVSGEVLAGIMQYLATKPYGEVEKIMNVLASNIETNSKEDNKPKK